MEHRRATEDEIRIAKAWVEWYGCQYDESGDSLEIKLEREYEHALEIIIFANGGRQGVDPLPRKATKVVDLPDDA